MLCCLAAPAFADAPVVTLTHPDTGWDDYADGWRVEDADGTVLGVLCWGIHM